MGFVDGLVSGVVSSVVYGISGLFSGVARAIGSVISKKIRMPERWETIKVDEEEKKFTFEGSVKDGYTIVYTGKPDADRNGRMTGTIGLHDLRGFEQKTESAAIWFLIYKLELIHDYLKNRELATRVAKKILGDIREKSKKK